MSTPAISVNLCVWKPDPRFFPQAVESILNQTFTDFELIIVEDPSDRDGRAMIRNLLGDSRIRYIKNKNRTGLCAQRNLAIELSRAPYIAVMDADDIAELQRLEKQFLFAESNPEIKVHGCCITIIDEGDHIIGVRRYPTDHQDVTRAMRRYNAIAHPTAFANKNVLQAVGGYVPEYPVAEDYELWARLLREGHALANLPDLLLRYRIHLQSIKATRTKITLRNTLKVKRRYFLREFHLFDWLRYFGEHLLLVFPSGIVNWLFMKVTYRSQEPSHG